MPVFLGQSWPKPINGGVTTVTWSFATANYDQLTQTYSGYDPFDSQIADTYKATIRSAFTVWEKYAKIDLVEVVDSASVNIRVGNNYIDGPARPGQSSTLAIASSWYVGSSYTASQISYDDDAYSDRRDLFSVSVHEIGHALGLDHSNNPANVMYEFLNDKNGAGQPTADDIAGIVQIYGALGSTTPAPAPNPPSTPAPASTATAPVVAMSLLINGRAPTQLEFTGQTQFAKSQYDYYANVLHVANPAIGPYEALGVALSDTGAYQARYHFAAESNASFVARAYQDVFLRAPSPLQQTAFSAQIDYFNNLYKGAGIAAATALLHARGAALGQMVGYVMTDPAESFLPGHTLDDKVASFLLGVGNGTAPYGQKMPMMSDSDGYFSWA